MGTYRSNIRLIAPAIVALVLLFIPGKLGAAGDPSATFYLSPSLSTVETGSSLSIELRITVTNDTTHGARARLTYPTDKLEVTGVDPAPPFFPAKSTSGGGIITLDYGSFSAVSGNQRFATISFKAVGSSGDANIIIDPIIDANNHSYVAGDASGTGANILTSVSNGTYTITKTSAAPPPASPPPASSSQVKPPSATSQDAGTTPVAGGDGSAPVAQSTKTIVPEAGADGGGPVTPASIFDRTVVLLALPAVILASLIARQANRHYKRIRSRRRASRRETVADIAARLNAPDKSNETVAELAARLMQENPAEETVAELAARLRRKHKRKPARRRRSSRRRHQ